MKTPPNCLTCGHREDCHVPDNTGDGYTPCCTDNCECERFVPDVPEVDLGGEG